MKSAEFIQQNHDIMDHGSRSLTAGDISTEILEQRVMWPCVSIYGPRHNCLALWSYNVRPSSCGHPINRPHRVISAAGRGTVAHHQLGDMRCHIRCLRPVTEARPIHRVTAGRPFRRQSWSDSQTVRRQSWSDSRDPELNTRRRARAME